MADKIRIAVTCGDIPARLDQEMTIISRPKQAHSSVLHTINMITNYGHHLTLVTSKMFENELPGKLKSNSHVKNIVYVKDVLEYYDWCIENARNFDVFIMAANLPSMIPARIELNLQDANITHSVKFEKIPNTLHTIKQLNPKARLIGYEFQENAEQARLQSNADVIFAINKKDPETYTAITEQSQPITCELGKHTSIINEIIKAEYFTQEISPITTEEFTDGEIITAMELVRAFDKTLQEHGAVVFPIKNNKQFVISSGHPFNRMPVLIRSIDYETGTIYATGQTETSAAAMCEFAKNGQYVVHRHFNDPMANEPENAFEYAHYKYIVPGTVQEYKIACEAVRANRNRINEQNHGYIQAMPFKCEPCNNHDKYFGAPAEMLQAIQEFTQKDLTDTLEIAGGEYPKAGCSIDSTTRPKNKARQITFEDLSHAHFDFTFAKDAICCLSPDEIKLVLAHSKHFMANAPAVMPHIKIRDNEISGKIKGKYCGSLYDKIVHYQIADNDQVIRHEFYAYNKDFYEKLGLSAKFYRTNSILLTWPANWDPNE